MLFFVVSVVFCAKIPNNSMIKSTNKRGFVVNTDGEKNQICKIAGRKKRLCSNLLFDPWIWNRLM